MQLEQVLLLVAAGVAAGFVNAVAGGGSVFTVPALMLLGMPADLANGTNRVGVVMQSVAGVRGFKQHGMLDEAALWPILLPTVVGSLLGALAASLVPATTLKPILLGSMLLMTALVVLRPATFPATHETPSTLRERPAAYAWLFAAGLYGGFVQAGVGFILLTALAGVLRYDLVRANALKMACTLVFGAAALLVFVWRGQVSWLPGLIVGLSTMVGVKLSVRFAVKAKQATLKWIFLGMACVVCIAALLR